MSLNSKDFKSYCQESLTKFKKYLLASNNENKRLGFLQYYIVKYYKKWSVEPQSVQRQCYFHLRVFKKDNLCKSH